MSVRGARSPEFTSAVIDYAQADYQVRVSELSTGTRHQVAVTYRDPGVSSNKTFKLYLDGSLQGTLSVPPSVSGTNNRLSSFDDRNVWLGRSNYNSPYSAGTIDEFRIYAVLSDSQISASRTAGPDP